MTYLKPARAVRFCYISVMGGSVYFIAILLFPRRRLSEEIRHRHLVLDTSRC